MTATYSAHQTALTDLMLNMKVMPLETMIRPLTAAIKQVTKLTSDNVRQDYVLEEEEKAVKIFY